MAYFRKTVVTVTNFFCGVATRTYVCNWFFSLFLIFIIFFSLSFIHFFLLFDIIIYIVIYKPIYILQVTTGLEQSYVTVWAVFIYVCECLCTFVISFLYSYKKYPFVYSNYFCVSGWNENKHINRNIHHGSVLRKMAKFNALVMLWIC